MNNLNLTNEEVNESNLPDLICLSHLRWDFVYQRPQHLMSRFAQGGRVFYFEEPIFFGGDTHLAIDERGENLFVCVPHINENERPEASGIQEMLLAEMLVNRNLLDYIAWYYTPMALEFSAPLKPVLTVFDCMDELSAFKFAPPELVRNEARLMEQADLVFTGGQSLFEAKKDRHPKVFAFPSSIDREHFARSREISEEPSDQSEISSPKLGYCGVIDERMDTILIAEMADLRPDWQFVMIGPVVKISEEDLPRRSNLHYLGGKDYANLPEYLSGWDAALMPFALNESTKFISPTKTPEYLAAGKPVVSTPIRDVVRPYGEENLVAIASTAEEFVEAAEKYLERGNLDEWLARVDEFLAQNSWDQTFSRMRELMSEEIRREPAKAEPAAIA